MKKSREHTIHYLWHSVEMHTILRDVLIYTVLYGVMWLLTMSENSNAGLATITLLLLVPFLVFYTWRIVCIFRKIEDYLFFECKLNQPHSHFWLKMMYFTVRLEMSDGKAEYVDTHAIFAAHGIMEPRMEDYVNSKVTIAYNPSTGMVVVVG